MYTTRCILIVLISLAFLATNKVAQSDPYLDIVDGSQSGSSWNQYNNIISNEDNKELAVVDPDDYIAKYLDLRKANNRDELYVLEDKDYPRFLFENYTGVGQVSGIASLPNNDVIMFHRANREWTSDSFDAQDRVLSKHSTNPGSDLIKQDTIMILNKKDGSAKTTFGSNIFYMPHGIASDQEGNLWLTDVGRHQVIRLPVGNSIRAQDWSSLKEIKPDIVLGEAFTPGTDEFHFCKPSEVKIANSGDLIYVADGYCNRRVSVFNSTGGLVMSFGENIFPKNAIIHSLAIFERRNMICVAERTFAIIYCFKAGLDGNLDSLGDLITIYEYPMGEVYAIVEIGSNNLLVSSKRFNSQRYDMATLNLVSREVRPVWISSDLLEPHSLARSNDGFLAYAADVSPNSYKKLFEFQIVKGKII